MLTVHTLKLKDIYFQAVVEGKKTFELRYNDRNYQTGDIIALCDINEKGHYLGCVVVKQISYVLADYEGLKDNWVILGLNAFDTNDKSLMDEINNQIQQKFAS